jgi:hypothetical protein
MGRQDLEIFLIDRQQAQKLRIGALRGRNLGLLWRV